MSRAIRSIALAAAVLVPVAAGLALVVDDEGDPRPGPTGQPLASGEQRPRAPDLRRCPPPGPAVVVQGTTLCGEDARRYIDREQSRQKRQAYEAYGFTPAKKRLARRIIGADATLDRLLRGKRHRIALIVPATAGTRLVGAAATLEVSPPIVATAVLPYACEGDPAAGEGRMRQTMRNVTRLLVRVRFEHGRVVMVTPTSSGGGPPPEVTSTVLPGSARCPKTPD